MNKQKRFNQIVKDIKEVKIQGARNIAKKALYAYSLIPTKASRKKLLSLRPTEPMLENILEMAEKGKSIKEIKKHFNAAQEKINKNVFKIIENNDVVFTHCHSTNVVNALIYAKKKGKRFEIYNTETRPLFQGRKTARELRKAGIKVTMFVDSALGVALSKEQGTEKVDKIFIGADAILKKGVINKIGSEVIAQIAKNQKIPVYIVADSWKYTPKKTPIENRKLNEVWDKAPKNIKIKNPAFEFIPKKYIEAIISELGTLSYASFLKKAKSAQ
ncbi:methylthioribose-1-phosphate isomerase [archaeon BMS3Abin17]|nr:methylthioribose-1-phosphate isomerase [archaeon BMS3Abin17]HDZ60392.1 translation initiation factor eIF-2B [Candidatus Pacearchaeota archaeon]